MKIILTTDVKKQGKKGEIIEVKDGYGTFLINNNKAVLATNYGVTRLNKEKEENALNEAKQISECEQLKKKLESITIEFKVKTGVQDKVFGSISTKQISDELTKKGYKIDKKQIEIISPLSSLGTHKVVVNLHKKVKATLNIKLVK